MGKPEYKQNIIACKKCGGTNTRVYKFGKDTPDCGPIWYVECECGIMAEWPHEDFSVIPNIPTNDGLTKSDIPLLRPGDGLETQ